jgi:hypothetical protein
MTSLANFKMAEYTPVSGVEKEDRNGVLLYGTDNAFPNYLIELAQSSPVHGALCISIAEMIAGKGVTGDNQVMLDELDLDQILPAVANDLKKQGGYYLEVIYSLDRKSIAKINHLPFVNCRLAIDKETENITGVWYSKDWANVLKKRNKPVFMHLFNSATKEAIPKQCYYYFEPTDGTQFYPKPDYWSAVNFIEAARQIGLYNVNSYLNGLFPSIIFNFRSGVPSPEDQEKNKFEIDRMLTGARNTGKWIGLYSDGGDKTTEIEAFPMTEANTAFHEMSYRQATEQVMIGHRVTTPRLFGVADSGNGLSSNTDEMKTGLRIFNSQVIEPKQRKITDGFEEILQAVGYMGTIKIIPNTPIALDEPIVAPIAAKLSAEKKSRDITLAESEAWLTHLDKSAEEVDLEEWELVSECQSAGTHEEELQSIDGLSALNFANEGSYANGDEKSKWGDAGLYKLRYAYSQNIAADSREFCKRMVALSLAGKVFRYEDIKDMGEAGINGQFAPQGESTYDLFQWKGGCFCHHFWKRQIYFRKRAANGQVLPNDGLKNDVRVANVPYVKRKGVESVAPIKTPTRGSLLYP